MIIEGWGEFVSEISVGGGYQIMFLSEKSQKPKNRRDLKTVAWGPQGRW